MLYTLILSLLLSILPHATLSLSTTEATPGAPYVAYATLYGTGEHVVTVADQTQRVTLDGEHGAVLVFPLVAPTQPSLTPYVVQMEVDRVVVDSRGLRVCCEMWPDAKTEHRLWLPMLRR